ncbi:hypothetical protein [Rhodococcus sp. SGAir0479]
MSPFENVRLPRVVTTGVAQLGEQRIDTGMNIRGIDTVTGMREVSTWKWY